MLRREGWYYLLVLSFVVCGAVLRQVNLLLLLAGLMVAPLLLNWRLAAVTIRRMGFKRKLPLRGRAGEPMHVDLTASNTRRSLASWAIVVEDKIRRVGASSAINRTKALVMFPQVGPGDTVMSGYRCELPRRGKYEFGPFRVSTSFPLGLVETSIRANEVAEVLVAPRLGNLTPEWRKLAEDDRVGSQRTHNRQGLAEGELYGLREWRRGDSRRWIHWRTSAKVNEIIVRQFEQQRNLDLALILDLWLPPNATEEQEAYMERVISFAATAIAERCRQGGGSLTVSIAGAKTQRYGAAASPMFRQDMLDRLAVVQGGDGEHLAAALEGAYEIASPGARLVALTSREIDQSRLVQDPRWSRASRSHHHLERTHWIDVTTPASRSLFYFDGE